MTTPFKILDRPLRNLGDRVVTEDGLTLVEVLVTALMVGLIGLTLVGLDAANQTTADQRRRSQAVQVAEQDQERIKGLSADQIATLNQSRTVTVDGVPFTVKSVGKFISSSSAAASCSATAAAADYAKVITTVDWAANARTDVVEQSVITPRAGGSVVADVNDQTGAALPGATVNLMGTDATTGSVRRRGTTDVDGCTIFGSLLVGDYSMTTALSGYVDPQGNSTPTGSVTATAGNTSSSVFSMGKAGSITANFSSVLATGQSAVTPQKVPSMSWNNSGMLTPGVNSPTTPQTGLATATNLYPFTVSASSYTKNYTVWAGSCSTDLPPSSVNQYFATVSPGSAATTTVVLPAMAIIAQLKNASSTVRVVPDHVKLTDSCGQSWNISGTDLNTATGTTAASGVLKFPGQPYSSNYTVCIDDTVGTTAYKSTTTTPNTTFTTATSKTITIDSTLTANKGTC